MFNNYHLCMEEEEALNYVANVLTPTRTSIKRQLSEDSDTSIVEPAGKMANSDNSDKPKTIDDLHQLFSSFMETHTKDMVSIKSDVSELKKNMLTETSLNKVRNDIMLEVNTVSGKLNTLENNITQFKTEYNKKIELLEQKILEVKVDSKDYDIDTTCVVTGMYFQTDENLLERCKELVHVTLDCPHVDIKQVKRTKEHEGRHGIVKIEFHSLADKISVLRKKKKLKELGSRIFIRSSLSHEQRLLQQHTMEILKMLGKDNEYYINGSGRLIAKNNRTQTNVDVTRNEEMMASILEGVKTFFRENPPPPSSQSNSA